MTVTALIKRDRYRNFSNPLAWMFALMTVLAPTAPAIAQDPPATQAPAAPAVAAPAPAPAQTPATPAPVPVTAPAEPLPCAKLGDFRLPADEIAIVQENLADLGMTPGNIDGMVGPETRSGLNRFCKLTQASVERQGDEQLNTAAEESLVKLIAAYHGLFGSRHNDDWKTILANPAFQKWVSDSNERATRMRKSGTTEQILEILDQWVNMAHPIETLPTEDKTSGPPLTIPELIHSIETRTAKTNVEWESGKGCGCLRDFADKTVYGLYPFWNADKKAELDFSVLSRIGYFAIPLDDRGIAVRNRGHWQLARSAFINQARRYNTDVDLVIYNDKWDLWTTPQPHLMSDLADQISSMVLQKMNNTLLNQAIPFLTFNGDPVPSMGDGVTLFFNFGSRSFEKNQQTAMFGNTLALITELKTKLRSDGRRDRKVNVLLQMHDFAVEPQHYRLADINRILLAADLVLVVNDETDFPASQAKKKLRDMVELDFPDAATETQVLRKMIPVISPLRDKDAHLASDLIYFEDNFGGVGFLPAPLSSDSDLNQAVIDRFTEKAKDSDPVSAAIHLPDTGSKVCLIVCPNGWLFQGAFLYLLLIGFIASMLWMVFVDFRIWIAKWPIAVWIWGGLAFVIGLSLSFCDKSFEGRHDEFLAVLLVGILILFLIRQTQRKRESTYP